MKRILLGLILIGSFLIADYNRDNNTNIVFDSYSELMWQDEEDITIDIWENAIRHCEVLELGGYSDWRLPNINELFRIVQKSYTKPPRIDKVYFKNTKSSVYWSSTTNIRYSYPYYAWIVDFEDGNVLSGKKDKTAYIRCVRGGK